MEKNLFFSIFFLLTRKALIIFVFLKQVDTRNFNEEYGWWKMVELSGKTLNSIPKSLSSFRVFKSSS